MATFTTWAALKTATLNYIASRDGTVLRASLPDGSSIQYHTVGDAIKWLEYIEKQVAIEAGTASGRTFAKQGGRGSWDSAD